MKETIKRKSSKFLLSFFRAILLIGLCYLILSPFIDDAIMGFMSPGDLLDVRVQNIPLNFSTYYWKHAWNALDIGGAGLNTFITSFVSALLQVICCTLVGYGLGRSPFKAGKILTAALAVIMLVPYSVYSVSQYLLFKDFLFFGNLINTSYPLYILSFFGMGLKEAFYIYLMKEFFKSLPSELEQAAYVDGASIFKTFILVMVPNVRNIMLTIFMLSFCWQWTDVSFTSTFYNNQNTLATKITSAAMETSTVASTQDVLGTAIARHTAIIIAIIPLLLMYAFCQKSLVRSIARSGLAN
ncbi:MAG: carbohydrate ABC transporter permease [Clostridia bacterium]|nr:carbohydrate ABC transporter permease [Clostridia bacterium]